MTLLKRYVLVVAVAVVVVCKCDQEIFYCCTFDRPQLNNNCIKATTSAKTEIITKLNKRKEQKKQEYKHAKKAVTILGERERGREDIVLLVKMRNQAVAKWQREMHLRRGGR